MRDDGPAPMTPLGFDHIVLRVRDLAAARRFYVEVLGCTVDRVNDRLPLIHLRFGAQQIDLVPGAGAGAAETDAGIDHYCLSIRCDDLAALAAVLKSKGAAVEDEVGERFGAYGDGPSLYLRDPDGYKVELKPR